MWLLRVDLPLPLTEFCIAFFCVCNSFDSEIQVIMKVRYFTAH